MKKIIVVAFMFVVLGAGCARGGNPSVPSAGNKPSVTTTPAPTPTPEPDIATTSTITYYVSSDPKARITYCGGPTDSVGYKKTLTVEVSKEMNIQFVGEEKIKKTLEMAVADTDFWNSPYTRVASTTFENGVVTVRPAGGFAGVSLFMCAWQPFVEKQLTQFPEVKQVKWEPAS